MEFAALRSKTYSCLTDHDNKNKNKKTPKMVPCNKKLNLKIIKSVYKQIN